MESSQGKLPEKYVSESDDGVDVVTSAFEGSVPRSSCRARGPNAFQSTCRQLSTKANSAVEENAVDTSKLLHSTSVTSHKESSAGSSESGNSGSSSSRSSSTALETGDSKACTANRAHSAPASTTSPSHAGLGRALLESGNDSAQQQQPSHHEERQNDHELQQTSQQRLGLQQQNPPQMQSSSQLQSSPLLQQQSSPLLQQQQQPPRNFVVAVVRALSALPSLGVRSASSFFRNFFYCFSSTLQFFSSFLFFPPPTPFYESFEREFGLKHPDFFMGSLQEAIDTARRSERLLVIYFHCMRSAHAKTCCSKVLSDDLVIDMLNHSAIFFATDSISSLDALRLLRSLLPSSSRNMLPALIILLPPSTVTTNTTITNTTITNTTITNTTITNTTTNSGPAGPTQGPLFSSSDSSNYSTTAAAAGTLAIESTSSSTTDGAVISDPTTKCAAGTSSKTSSSEQLDDASKKPINTTADRAVNSAAIQPAAQLVQQQQQTEQQLQPPHFPQQQQRRPLQQQVPVQMQLPLHLLQMLNRWVLLRLQGEELSRLELVIAALVRAQEKNVAVKEAKRKKLLEHENNRRLREEQEMEFVEVMRQEALKAEERERQRVVLEKKKQQEEQRRQQQEEQQKKRKATANRLRLQIEKEEKELLQEMDKEAAAAAAGASSSGTLKEGGNISTSGSIFSSSSRSKQALATAVCIRLPSGSRISRRFPLTAALEDLYEWAECLGELSARPGVKIPWRFILVAPPNKILERNSKISLIEAGLHPNAAVLLVAVDDEAPDE